MVLPIENKADFFKHDKHLRNDLRIKGLRDHYGIKGYAIYLMLLEVLTGEKDFRLKVNGLNYEELLALDFEIQLEEFKQIFSFMCALDLFKVVTLETGNYLISTDFEKRL